MNGKLSAASVKKWVIWAASSNAYPCVSDMACEPDSIDMRLSTNPVFRFCVQGTTKYFRWIKQHDLFDVYVRGAIRDFFVIQGTPGSNAVCRALQSDACEPTNYAKIQRYLKLFNDKIWEIRDKTLSDFESLGFPSLSMMANQNERIAFVLYMRGEIADFYSYSSHFRGMQTKKANLQFATKKLADCLGISEMIPGLRYATISVNGSSFFGTLMDDAHGVEAAEIGLPDRQRCSQSFIRQLYVLELFDAICFQTDRKQKNYNVISKNGMCVAVSAFDNDCPTTFSPTPFLPNRMSLNSAYKCVVKKGRINRSLVDKEFARSVQTVDIGVVRTCLKGHLNFLQIVAVCCRIKSVRRALKKTLKEKPEIFVGSGETGAAYKSMDSKSYAGYFFTVDERQLGYGEARERG